MNFYQHQDRARRKTAVLVLYFVLAVVCIALALNAVAFLMLQGSSDPPTTLADYARGPVIGFVTLAVFGVITAGSLYTTARLRGGGKALASMLGARRIEPDTSEFRERQLVNVVEEMSIASGTPVPALYVLDGEAGINAFVAGLRPTQTVMVVTKGALEAFSRDELQGVVAHEYSHVFNGDTRINLRLMGVVAGIVLIGQIGRFMLRSGSRGRGKGAGQMALAGFAVLVIGYVGLFFGGLIKAAISRQREFLADASAVQFTRNPEGIAGALYRIRAHAGGSVLDNAHAEDVSHFCISESVHHAFASLMATHPPLDARIRAIDPDYLKRRAATPDAGGGAPANAAPAGAAGFAAGVSAAAVADSVGTVRPEHVAHARALHEALPEALVTAAHGRSSAPAIACALVLATNAPERRAAGLELIAREVDDALAAASGTYAGQVAALPPRSRLPLLMLSLPALGALADDAASRFLQGLKALIEFDGRYTVFEFAALYVLRDHLGARAEHASPVRYYRYADVRASLVLLFSVLARAGTTDETEARAAFDRAWKPFGEPGTFAAGGVSSLDALSDALERIEALSPLLKQSVIHAAADCVIHDGRVMASEAELLQVIAICLDCPMPPLLDA